MATTRYLPDTLVKTFPQGGVPEGTVLVALEVSFDRVVAQVYRTQKNKLLLEAYDEMRSWGQQYNTYTLGYGKDDPLMPEMLLRLGVYWTPEAEIVRDHLLEQQANGLVSYLNSLAQAYRVGHVTLLGMTSGMDAMRELVCEGLRIAPSTLVWEEAFIYGRLADKGAVEAQIETLLVTQLSDFFDLLTVQIIDDRLCWKREPLFGPGQEIEHYGRQVFLTPQTEKCHLFVGKFAEQDFGTPLEIDALPPESIVYAAEVRDFGARDRLRYDIRIDGHERIYPTFEQGKLQELPKSAIGERMMMLGHTQLKTIPMQTAIYIDASLLTRQFKRCKDLIDNLLADKNSPEYRWVLYVIDDSIVQLVMGDAFLPTFEFQARLNAYQHNPAHLEEKVIDFSRMFTAMEKLSWQGDSANYYLLITQCYPKTDVAPAMKRIRQKWASLDGMVLWLGNYVEENKMAGFHAIGRTHVSEIREEAEQREASRLISDLLVPSEQKERELTNLPWPISH